MQDKPASGAAPLLQAQGLTVSYRSRTGSVTAVDEVTLEVRER